MCWIINATFHILYVKWYIWAFSRPSAPLHVIHSIHLSTIYTAVYHMIHWSLFTTICTTACDTFNPSLNHLHHCIWHIQSITQPSTPPSIMWYSGAFSQPSIPLYVKHSIHHTAIYTTVYYIFSPSHNSVLISHDTFEPFHNHLHHFILCSTSEPILFLSP